MIRLVSVIIPVYNVEKYLARCIESVLTQSFHSIEIVLVDDGSTDNSSKICDEFAARDKRIIVFHKKNEGLSVARNYGKLYSSGDYIIFLDSDDFWNNNDILLLLVRKAEKYRLDVVRGEYIDVNENEEILFVPKLSMDKLSYKDKVFSSYEMIKHVINGCYFTVLFLYKRVTLDGLFYDEKRKFQEDIDFAIRYFSSDLRCGYVPIQFYSYRHRRNSITSTPRILNIVDSFKLTDIYYEFAHKVYDKRLGQLYLYNAVMMYYWTLETVASDLYIGRYNEINEQIDLEQLHNKVYGWMKENSPNHYPIHLYVKPYIGIRLFRIRWFIGRLLRKLHIYNLLK